MALKLRIFETDPDAEPKPRSRPDIVGRFRAGRREGRSAVTLDTWRVTTGEREVADKIADLYGGTPEEWETDKEDFLEVLTDADKVDVIIGHADDIESDMKLYSATGALIHHCDGVCSLLDDDRGEPCGCPPLLYDRKALAREGRGPKPDSRVRFKLAEAPELGTFQMRSSSWDFAKVLHFYQNDVEDQGGPALATMGLETVSFTAKSGPRKGRTVSYKRPFLKVQGPAPVE